MRGVFLKMTHRGVLWVHAYVIAVSWHCCCSVPDRQPRSGHFGFRRLGKHSLGRSRLVGHRDGRTPGATNSHTASDDHHYRAFFVRLERALVLGYGAHRPRFRRRWFLVRASWCDGALNLFVADPKSSVIVQREPRRSTGKCCRQSPADAL